jgi:hypothetical protein
VKAHVRSDAERAKPPSINRRTFGMRALAAAGGIALPWFPLLSLAHDDEGVVRKGKSVVLLFLQGGPPHIEFFDPKMSAAAEFRSITGEVPTTIPGVTFGGTFPRLAERAKRLAVVRSYGTQNILHTYLSITSGGNPLKAAAGAILAKWGGLTHRATGMPRHAVIVPEAVDPGLQLETSFETDRIPSLTDPGELGKSFDAFNPGQGGTLQEDLSLQIPIERLGDRQQLLQDLDRWRRTKLGSRSPLTAMSDLQQQAIDVVSRKIADAFDLRHESERVVERYDTSRIFPNSQVQTWADMRRATNLLGKQFLLARRLCETGCGFVTISDCGWDMHADHGSPANMAALWPKGQQVDHAVSVFLDDLHDRGMQDDVLLIVTGEMGRTPRLNSNGGRDHHGDLTTLLFAGGGLRMGQVIGQSDRTASAPLGSPLRPGNLFSTIMHFLFDITKLRLLPQIPKPLLAFIDNQPPIAEL